jgi:tetratricopeptide (TPR) repeat protein/transcriptional regulator with XRE-family HTH domain
VDQQALSFAGLLRQLRAEARLTQEELAEAAGLSPRSVSDLERGIHATAHKDTAGLLADALSLAEPVRTLFITAARGKAPASEVLAARQAEASGAFVAAPTRALPRDIASFTGREAELEQLLRPLAFRPASGGVVGIHAIGGMAGIGKTTFAVHAAHQLASSFPDGQFFLPLHAHTAGQRPVDPADALGSLLLTAGVPAAQIPPGLEARASRWRDQVAGKKILLLLDDAASHEQVRPLLPGTAGSLVLVTSRRRLTALDDTAVITLDPLPPAQAATLLAQLAARAGIRAEDPAVGDLARLGGYLPLAIGMLASQLRHHPAWTAAGLAADLAGARDRLALMRAENLSVAAAFDLSYHDLTEDLQRLFRRLGLVPGPSFDGYAAAALGATSPDTARRHLGELYDQHLLTEPAPGRYQLHDLLREHARALADDDDPADRAAATDRLLDYYLHTTVAAGRGIATPQPAWRYTGTPTATAAGRLLSGDPSVSIPKLAASRQAAAWLEAERPNLHAAVGYAAASERPRHAIALSSALSGFLYAHNHWDQSVALHQLALTVASQAKDPAGEAIMLGELGALQRETGDYPAAAASLTRALALYRDTGDLPGQGYVLDHLGFLHSLTGDYPAAAACHGQALALFRDGGDRLGQAESVNSLGVVQQLTGDYLAAASSHQQALALYADVGHLYGQANALHDFGVVQQLTGDYPAATASHRRALALFEQTGNQLGVAYVLNDLGVVQQLTGDFLGAAASHQQALALFGDLGNRLGQAEALNNLGELSFRTSSTGQAREHHNAALKIARDLSAPLEEARALEGTGRAHLQDGSIGHAAAYLRSALTIYQHIGAPGARRVQEILRQHGLTPISSMGEGY